MRQHRECANMRQVCGVEQRQCAVERERCATSRGLSRTKGDEEEESKDLQIILFFSAQCAFITTHR